MKDKRNRIERVEKEVKKEVKNRETDY